MKSLLKSNFMKKIKFYIVAISCYFVMIWLMLAWLFTHQKNNKINRTMSGKRVTKLIASDVEIIGKPDTSCGVIAINHRNVFDILMIEALYAKDICWVGKKELNGPMMSILMKYSRQILIDREAKSSMLDLIKKSKKAFSNNRPIVIFPEGTRNKRETLLPFKEGARVIAEILKTKVQPIIITGLDKRMNIKEQILDTDQKVKLIFLDPIEADRTNKEWYKNLYDKMNTCYKEES